MELVDPEVSASFGAGADELRALIEWTVAFDGRMVTTCRPGRTEALVLCDWMWRTAGTEALGLGGAGNARRFTIVDGLIVAMTVPNYRAFERPLAQFAAQTDPEGYSEACSPDGTSPISSSGFPRNARCARFVAAMEPAFVASLDG